ncbi:hypothetical protein L596_024848 [Steinernema carpocapsae]|uniref:Uncharacterized protein n=1 Tax=Steinernema carpocapsae TaxID=34508 RepID=A0A4U5M606_STECR|nr:hypothetical protein L596_024845 [Steinernema carpocapsae]TKR64286.1 hypothetical protein L596_024848 [Steinernema carpocapsae]
MTRNRHPFKILDFKYGITDTNCHDPPLHVFPSTRKNNVKHAPKLRTFTGSKKRGENGQERLCHRPTRHRQQQHRHQASSS